MVQFFFLEKVPSLKDRIKLKTFLPIIFKQEKVKLDSLTYIFCSDEYLLEINRDFLKHDYYTDIITFTLSDTGMPIVGEIYISIDRVLDNARKLQQPLVKELHRVIFHGALHLCGYKDKRSTEEKLMRTIEDQYLNKYLKVR